MVTREADNRNLYKIVVYLKEERQVHSGRFADICQAIDFFHKALGLTFTGGRVIEARELRVPRDKKDMNEW